MRKILLYTSASFSSGLFFTLLYNSVVNAANWESNIPHSISATRNFFVVANPGTFFQIIDPANMLLIFLSMILWWKTSATIRNYLALALLLYISSMVLTFTYFYPRNDIMFTSKQIPEVHLLQKAASEWGRMGWVRCTLAFTGVILTFLALNKSKSLAQQ